MDIAAAIKGRRTVRRFKQQPVEREKLYQLIDAARLASSGANRQPLRYVVVQDSCIVGQLFTTAKWALRVVPRRTPVLGVSAPPVFIVVTVDSGTNPQVEAGAAIENIQLMAFSLGLGCCWIGAYDRKTADKIIGLPESAESIYLVAVGYPDESPVSEDINLDADSGYYLDDNNVLHVPKYAVDAITCWR